MPWATAETGRGQEQGGTRNQGGQAWADMTDTVRPDPLLVMVHEITAMQFLGPKPPTTTPRPRPSQPYRPPPPPQGHPPEERAWHHLAVLASTTSLLSCCG
jgi:hypothetical protein